MQRIYKKEEVEKRTSMAVGNINNAFERGTEKNPNDTLSSVLGDHEIQKVYK